MAKRPFEDDSEVDLTVSEFTEASPKAKVHSGTVEELDGPVNEPAVQSKS